MEVKRDILWRVYICFLGMTAIGFCVLGRAFYLQHVQGEQWRNISDSLHQKWTNLGADRGTIYSSDKSMLSTSIPFFNIYVDFGADGLKEKNGRRFRENLDSLAYCLAHLFKDKTSVQYKHALQKGFKEEDRYYLLQQNISFDQYKVLRSFPLVRLGKNKSGFIAEVNNKRMNPFGLLANRTIGLARENAQNVGLERTYDTLLKGETGKRLVRYIAAGTYVPVEGSEIDPENGKDILTTIDVTIQDIAENALLKMMHENECETGTVIVMEVATGKIKAIANLGRQSDGSYWEDLNYAIRASEPGSTFKLATILSLLEDKSITLSDKINLEGGSWKIANRTVYDVEKHEKRDFTIKEAFELSSNVGMAKLAWGNYSKDPEQFINHLKKLRLNKVTGIDLLGETSPIVKTPKSRTWSATTLPWMAFGYEVLISPLQTLTLYNAVANEGKMMRPYLVDEVQVGGQVVRKNEPVATVETICSKETLQQLKECLEGVCIEGTAKNAFKGSLYKVAGKTGTALVANGNRGYADHIYQSSFAGYFPADHPKYSCIVVIKNKPFAKKYLGALVAGPVWKEVSDKLMSLDGDMYTYMNTDMNSGAWKKDSSRFFYAGNQPAMKKILSSLDISYQDSSAENNWARLYPGNAETVMNKEIIHKQVVPDVKGMGLKDALNLLENMKLSVSVKGKGKVKFQSLQPGTVLTKTQNILLELN